MDPRFCENEVKRLRSPIFLLIFTEPGNLTLAHACTTKAIYKVTACEVTPVIRQIFHGAKSFKTSHHEGPGLLLVGHVGEDLVPLEDVPHPLRVPVQPRTRETPAKG